MDETGGAAPGAPDRTASSRTLRSRGLPLLIAVVALLWLSALARFVLPDEQFRKYPEAARRHLTGELAPERLADFSPLYFELNVLAARLAGDPVRQPARPEEPSRRPERLLRDLQILITAGSSALLFLLLRRHLPLWASLAAVAAFLLDPALIVYTPLLEPEPLLVFFLLGMLLFAGRDDRLGAGVAGLFCAGGVLLRPTLLPALLLVPLAYRLRRLGAWRRASLLFAAPVLLALAGLSARNAAAFGSLSPTVMNPGTVFYEGNNPLSWGYSATYPPLMHLVEPQTLGSQPDIAHVLYRRLARASTGERLSIAEVNAYWSRRAMRFISDHPKRSGSVLLNKARVILRSAPEHDVRPAWRAERMLRASAVPLLPFSVVAASALLGALVAAGGDRAAGRLARAPYRGSEPPGWPGLRQHVLLYALLATQVGTMLIFYVSARQRLTALPLFLFFAAAAWSWMARQGRRAWLWVPLVLVLALGLSRSNDLDRDREHVERRTVGAIRLSRESQAMRDAGELLPASEAAARALALAPWALDRLRPAGLPYGPRGYAGAALDLSVAGGVPPEASAAFDLALLLRAAGEPRAAEEILGELGGRSDRRPRFARSGKHASSVRFLEAGLALDRGESERAERLLRQALEETPGDPFTLAHLALLAGDREAESRLRRYVDDVAADFLLGRAALEMGRSERAWELFSRVCARFPELALAWVYLAASTPDEERLEAGTAAYLRAMAIQSEPVLLEERILELFETHSRKRPADLQARLFYARVLQQFGHYGEALAELEAIPAGGEHESARRRALETVRRLAPRALGERR